MQDTIEFIKNSLDTLEKSIHKLSSTEMIELMRTKYGEDSENLLNKLKLPINRLKDHLSKEHNKNIKFKAIGNIVNIRQSLTDLISLINKIESEVSTPNNTSQKDEQKSYYLLIEACHYAENIFLAFYFEYMIDEYESKSKDSISQILSAVQRSEKLENDAKALIKRMKLTEAAVLKEGLTKSYKKAQDDLKLRVARFDKLNYASLLIIFVVTTNLFGIPNFIGLSKVSENIPIYERFILILPLIALSWFASKRSQFLYQIMEEYAYKYTTALAYEGYKDELEKDEKMLEKLMTATISNLARSPLEQFDKNSDHSPYTKISEIFKTR